MTWDTFFSAEVGASAALAGLIFVGLSINLKQIVALPMIANRALQALLVLLGILAISTLLLVPGEANAALGFEVLAIALPLLIVLDVIEAWNWRLTEKKWRASLLQHTAEIQVPAGLSVVAGFLLVVGNSAAIYWFVPATIVSFIVAISEAWVILVEIQR